MLSSDAINLLKEYSIQEHYQTLNANHETPTDRTATVTKIRKFEMTHLIATVFLHTQTRMFFFNEDEVAIKSVSDWFLCKSCKKTHLPWQRN